MARKPHNVNGFDKIIQGASHFSPVRDKLIKASILTPLILWVVGNAAHGC